MIDALSVLSLYRQLEGLEETVKCVGTSEVDRFLVACNNQEAFNHILNQLTEGCTDAPEYLQSFAHIQPVNIPKGGNRSVYPRFLAQVTMLRQAVRAFLELALSAEQKRKIGFA